MDKKQTDKMLEEALNLIKEGKTEKGISLITECASKGNAEAHYMLGCLFYRGEGMPRNYKKAIQHLNRACEKGNAEACFLLGSMYIEGKGCDKSCETAAKIWTQGAEAGNLSCAYNLSILYERGIGVAQDIHKSVSILRFCAENGLEQAAKKLETMKIPTDTGVDIEDLKKRAEAGEADAQYKLGTEYIRGRNIEKDKTEATRLFALSAKTGHFLSKLALFNRYYIDTEFDPCWTVACYWLNESIEHDARRFGIVHPNLLKALEELEKAKNENEKQKIKAHAAKAAELGYHGAYVFLGDLCEEDEKEAYGYYLKGSEHGDATAFLRLYDIYSNEKSELFNFEKGQEMLEKHAEISALMQLFTE